MEPPPTRLQRHTRRLTGRLTVLALALCALLALLQGSLSGDWWKALLASLALVPGLERRSREVVDQGAPSTGRRPAPQRNWRPGGF